MTRSLVHRRHILTAFGLIDTVAHTNRQSFYINFTSGHDLAVCVAFTWYTVNEQLGR